MAWFKVDDLLCGHRKARRAGKAALGLWVLAGSYASQQLTNGFVDEEFVASWGGRREAQRLVDAGFWTPTVNEHGEAGWQFHDWDEYQPTREQVMKERSRNKERQRRWRERNAVTDTVMNGVSNAAPTRPDPTRPERGVLRSVSSGPANPKRHLGDATEIGLG